MSKQNEPELYAHELRDIAAYLTEFSLSDATPMKLRTTTVGRGYIQLQSDYWARAPKALSEDAYADFYDATLKASAYDIRMLDGALIQVQYEFANPNQLRRSVQRYLPSPDLLDYQTSPDLYLQDLPYGDVVGPHTVIVPIRFDYDDRPESIQLHLHSASHLTLGQRSFCRIPASGPLTPRVFFEFILSAFYRTNGPLFHETLPIARTRSYKTIHDEERKLTHISFDTN